MSVLYKDKKDMTTFVEIENTNGVVKLEFSKDCGKFGTHEINLLLLLKRMKSFNDKAKER